MFKKFLFGISAAMVAVILLATVAEAAIVTLPTGVGPGERYRLVFFTSTSSQAVSTDIADYNAFVSGAAAADTALNALGTTWSAIASTATVDARDNVSNAMFVPIYNLVDAKVAFDNADLFDGGPGAWDDPLLTTIVNDLGTTSNGGYSWTGTLYDGTAAGANPLGADPARMGDTSVYHNYYINSGDNRGPTASQPLYAISGVLTAPGVAPPTPITVAPTGLNPGDEYRLAFWTSYTTTATSSDIADYNAFADGVANTVPELAALGATWKVIGSTATVAAKDNVGTAAGVPIYNVVDEKVADDDADLFDGGVGAWDDNLFAVLKNEVGTMAGQGYAWTGTNRDGTSSATNPFGTDPTVMGDCSVNHNYWINAGDTNGPTAQHPVYVISGVLTVSLAPPPIPGDADGDRDVDADDITIVASYWLQTIEGGFSVGDFDGNGVVDGIDATILATNWTGPLAAVPEPPTLVGLLVLCLLIARQNLWTN